MSDAGLQAVYDALVECDPVEKCRKLGGVEIGEGIARVPRAQPVEAIPGRPPRPLLCHPREMPKRSLGGPAGRAALLHAVAHIEFNAINLALDAIWRFEAMPADYYHDWLSVARDEARHFGLCRQRLREMGLDYGELPAHDGLWEAAQKTAHDVLARMACVPRVLEARGLDVTPGMIERLRQAGDERSVAVLEVILHEEVRHVAIGTRWFRELCAQRQLPPDPTFRDLLARHQMQVRPPFNWPAREAAGFVRCELPGL
ncbi:ferritin-like domain-containing protein [Algiphilus sp. W345]|uniref:Ferritin-like domain-containing protein n=1 Tax=Banduia mediterranea TaxID=3075609 RepID=A0ABU2WLH0_9GAMM|nr:ferritin-like domain-containing protein [Algiphilus sp. W345]MDT0498054.1 ferritin-like domain-containing protein [Algiphilus sp. W345]